MIQRSCIRPAHHPILASPQSHFPVFGLKQQYVTSPSMNDKSFKVEEDKLLTRHLLVLCNYGSRKEKVEKLYVTRLQTSLKDTVHEVIVVKFTKYLRNFTTSDSYSIFEYLHNLTLFTKVLNL